jgi:hypothetical protein
MCTKYVNNTGTTFVKCDKVNNGSLHSASYMMVFSEYDIYAEYINYCPNCGEKLTNEKKVDEWRND